MFKNLFKLGGLSLVFIGFPLSFNANDLTIIAGPQMDREDCHSMTVSFPKEGEGYLYLTDYNSINIYDANLNQVATFADDDYTRYDNWVIFEISNTKCPVMGDYSLCVSQCLFNDDSEFETLAYGGYIQVEPYTTEEFNEETQSFEEVTGYHNIFVRTSLKLMQSNGNCLAEIPLNSNVYDYHEKVIMLNDNIYIVLFDDNITYWYLWNKQQTSLNKVAELPTFQAFPNPVIHGEKFNIVLPENINGESTIAIYNMKGGLISVMQVDCSTVYVDTNNLSVGHYIYAVTNNGRQIVNGHLIVK